MTHAYRVAETSLKGTLKKVQAFLGKSFFHMNIKDFQKVKGLREERTTGVST